ERGRIVAGEAVIGELRLRRVALLIAHGAVDALDRQKGERIRADEAAHPLEIVRRREKLVALRRVDAVIIRMGNRRRGDAEMHLLGPGLAHHLHDLHRRGPAHYGVVDENDALAADHRTIGAVLEANTELADLLARLDEGAPDVMV